MIPVNLSVHLSQLAAEESVSVAYRQSGSVRWLTIEAADHHIDLFLPFAPRERIDLLTRIRTALDEAIEAAQGEVVDRIHLELVANEDDGGARARPTHPHPIDGTHEGLRRDCEPCEAEDNNELERYANVMGGPRVAPPNLLTRAATAAVLAIRRRDPDGGPERITCSDPTHVDGCPCVAGGDPELR